MKSKAPEEQEAIAIVGMACRFPGEATDPQSFWSMMENGQSAWSEFPQDRVNISGYYHPSNSRQGSVAFRGAHFLKEDVGAFDTAFFSITAEEAKAIDPQQRMLLEVTVEALDNAGIDRTGLRGSETGVWVGSFVKDYEQVALRDPDNSPQYGATGNGTAILSNRISFFLDIHGPSMTIDTGCSASMVCLHNAVQNLRNRDVDQAIVGAAGLILTPYTMFPMTALNFLSTDGKCYAFDSRANGYGRGEGVGIIVLKRLSDAVRDNDNIRGVIRGSRVNQDGRTAGITLPSAEAQLNNIRGVYSRSGLDMKDTSYVECHGTGTQAGDRRELKAVSEAFCSGRSRDNPIMVGSVKTNIGHLEACAGVSGVIKTVLSMEKGVIPKHLNFELPGNPNIDFEGWKVKVPIENTPWPGEGLRRASVNCFGFGGTNAHVIIDDAGHYLSQRGISAHHNTTRLEGDPNHLPSGSSMGPGSRILRTSKAKTLRIPDRLNVPSRDYDTQLFVFSAHDSEALMKTVAQASDYVQSRIDLVSPTAMMEDLSYTMGCRRTMMSWRVSVAAKSPEELISKLANIHSSDLSRASEEKPPKVGFVFGGQGAQWLGMGKELLGFDIFLQYVAEASEYLKDRVGCPFDLLEELLNDEGASRIDEPEIAQPATTVIQVALVDMLVEYFGVQPSSVCGHSSGEIAAAYAMGALSRENAWELSYHRGWSVSSAQSGRMLAVGASASHVGPMVDAVGRHRVTVACINSPTSVTLSGDSDAIGEIQVKLTQDGTFNRALQVTTAYHSHHMALASPAYQSSICNIHPRKPRVRQPNPHPHAQGHLLTLQNIRPKPAASKYLPDQQPPVMCSSLTGDIISWEDLTPEYWARNMDSPVLFEQAMRKMVGRKSPGRPDILLEIGPHSTLQGPIKQILDAKENSRHRPSYLSMLSRKRDAGITSLSVVGSLWAKGCSVSMQWINMRSLQSRRPRLLVDLPNYPWNHKQRYWHEGQASRIVRLGSHGRYDLIGRPTVDSISQQPRWKGFLRISETPWIKDHQVQKTVIYPAAGMITMVSEAVRQIASGDFSHMVITDLNIQKAMVIPSLADGLEYALNLSKEGGSKESDNYRFHIYSKASDNNWIEHGSGNLSISSIQQEVQVGQARRGDFQQATEACTELIVPRQLYETLEVIGMNYGPTFRNVTSLKKSENACVGTVQIPDTKSIMPEQFEYPHLVHPATIDAVLHTAYALESEPMVPSRIDRVVIVNKPECLSGAGKQLAVHARAEKKSHSNGGNAYADFVVADDSWLDGTSSTTTTAPLITIQGMKFTPLAASSENPNSGYLPDYKSLCTEIRLDKVDEENQDLALPSSSTKVLILMPPHPSATVSGLCSEISQCVDAEVCELDAVSSRQQQEGGLPQHCISLLEADGKPLVLGWTEPQFESFRRVVSQSRGLFWVTQTADPKTLDPQVSLFQALARTIHSEYPEKTLVSFVADGDFLSSTTAATEEILRLCQKSFFESKPARRDVEVDYIRSGNELFVPRLHPVDTLNKLVELGTASQEPEMAPMPDGKNRPLRMRVRDQKDVTSLYWEDDMSVHGVIGAHEVKIRITGSAISARDVAISSDAFNPDATGTDVFGTVEEVGNCVVNVVPGDQVMALTNGVFKDLVRCHCSLVAAIPKPSITPPPTGFAVAQYALNAVAKLSSNSTLLVHGCDDAYGQAALRVARAVPGIKIFTSVSSDGTEARDQVLDRFDIPKNHVMNVQDEQIMVEDILYRTGGQGVDVVFDASGQICQNLSLQCVRQGGHILQIRTPTQEPATLPAAMSGKTVIFSLIDPRRLIAETSSEENKFGEAFQQIAPRLVSGDLELTPGHHEEVATHGEILNYSQISDTVQSLHAKQKHSTSDAHYIFFNRDIGEAVQVPIVPPSPPPAAQNLHSDGTYVLSGGLGGLGLEIAKLLASQGVKHMAFLSRSGARTDLAASCVDTLQKSGVEVQIFKVDISDRASLSEAAGVIRRTMPPVRGVFQCAATLRDGVFVKMPYADWQAAVQPKTMGSWNLYQEFGASTIPTTHGVDSKKTTNKQNTDVSSSMLDFIVFLSSSAGVIGNRGQANYAAGNAFQDALAGYINKAVSNKKAHAVSLDLGPVLGAGMLAEDTKTLDILKASGFLGIRLQDFRLLIERAISGYVDGHGNRIGSQVVTGVGSGGLTRQNKPADPYWTRTALFEVLNKVDLPVTFSSGGEGGEDGEAAEEQRSIKELLSEVMTAATNNNNTTTTTAAEGSASSVPGSAATSILAAEEAAQNIVSEGLRTMLSRSLHMSGPQDVDGDRSPSAYGVDSLVAVAVRNWVFRECGGADVSVFEVLGDMSINELSRVIVERSGFCKQ